MKCQCGNELDFDSKCPECDYANIASNLRCCGNCFHRSSKVAEIDEVHTYVMEDCSMGKPDMNSYKICDKWFWDKLKRWDRMR